MVAVVCRFLVGREMCGGRGEGGAGRDGCFRAERAEEALRSGIHSLAFSL